MESNRPLRQSSNKQRDIYNTYMKNQDKDSKNTEKDQEILEDLEEKVGAAMNESEDEQQKYNELPEEPEHDTNTDEELKTLEDSIAAYKNENEHLKDQLARRTAEMENMRRRTEKEKMDMVQFANEKLLMNLLEIPDNIKQALLAAKDAKDFDSLKKGIELINTKTNKLFEEAGVKRMEVEQGDEFDVDKHEALMHTSNPDIADGHIIQVVQDGYYFKDKILRHAKVITSSGAE